jgi:hypothetical protein
MLVWAASIWAANARDTDQAAAGAAAPAVGLGSELRFELPLPFRHDLLVQTTLSQMTIISRLFQCAATSGALEQRPARFVAPSSMLEIFLGMK